MAVEIIIVLATLLATVILLAFDLLRSDLVGMLCMPALARTGVLSPQDALAGFSSNAVIAMIAVMVLGRGIARAGLMDHRPGCAEAVDEGHGPEPRTRWRTWAALSQRCLHRLQEDPREAADHLGLLAQVPAHAFGHRQHPLAARHPGQDLLR
ncbi:MAG: SLC13 family permease [Candidatus Krumholzibacteriia bacterium]